MRDVVRPGNSSAWRCRDLAHHVQSGALASVKIPAPNTALDDTHVRSRHPPVGGRSPEAMPSRHCHRSAPPFVVLAPRRFSPPCGDVPGRARAWVPRLSLLQWLGPVNKLAFARKKRTRMLYRDELGNQSRRAWERPKQERSRTGEPEMQTTSDRIESSTDGRAGWGLDPADEWPAWPRGRES